MFTNDLDPILGTGWDTSKVFFTKDISPEGLVKIYDVISKHASWYPSEHTAVKMSTGESTQSYYLRPDLIRDLIHKVHGTIVECNTAYKGNRMHSQDHLKAILDHGFGEFDVCLQDEFGSKQIPVPKGVHLDVDYVGEKIDDFDRYLILSHFKGHPMAGFGGAIKNISIGMASSQGKSYIHSGGTSLEGIDGDHFAFLESMGEAAGAVIHHIGAQNMIYINVLNNLSVDCDCIARPKKPTMADIGIVASTDPVAIDQVCFDLVANAEDSHDLMKRINDKHGCHTIQYAEQLGIGTRNYSLIDIDKNEIKWQLS